MDNQNQPSALDQAISSLHGALGAVGNFFGGVGHNIEQGVQSVGQDLQSGAGALGKAIDQSISNTGQYFDPTSNSGNNFWSTPVAQGLAGIQPHAENVLQGASLGYYQADPNLEKNVNPFVQELEKGAGAIVPFAAATALTGGAADAFLPEAFSEGALGSAVSTAGGGALTGLAAPATSLQQRLGNTVTGGITGGAFGLLGEANPIIQSAIGSLGAGGLTALQGGNPNQILANAALGLGTPLFFKAAEAFGGGDTGSNMMNNLYDKFGTDSYRFMANKDLIQRVVTGRGSPEDIAQFNILNRLGVAAEAARSPGGLSIEDEGTRVPKSGPVWDFLQTLFPNSFKAGAPTPDFTDPEKSPLAAIPEMALSPVENDALMKLDERNPSPTDQAVGQTHQELTDSQQLEAPESSVGTQKQEAEDTIIQALQQGNTQDATTLHQAISQELPLRSLDELKTEADQRATDQQQQLASVQSAISQDSLMQHPDIAQYKDVIRKAVRTYNLTKAKGTEDISTITNRVPGLDVALQAMREKNLDIQSMDQLATLAKNLPKKGMAVRPPQTAAEAVAVKAGKIPTQPSSDIVAEKAVTPADEKALAPEFATDEGLQPIHQVLDVANQEKPLLDQAFQELAQQNGGQFSSRVKSPETVKQKIVTKRQQGRMVGDRPYGLPDVNDLYGARITVPDAATKANILAQIHTLAKQGTFELMNSENVEKDTYHATHMDLRTQGGTRIELQLDTPQERAEALTNHPIRSLFGEQPPEAVNRIKLRNADIINQMPANQAKQLGDTIEAMHKADPEAATTKPIDLTKMPVRGDQPLVRRGVQDVNGTLFKTNVVDDLWNHIRTAKENQEELDQPGYFATSVLKDPTWQDYLKTHSDMNNHEGGPKTIADKNGYFAYVDPKTVIPDQANLNPVINKSILKQFVDNDPIIVRDNKDGTFSKVDGQHRVLTSRALENPRLPALVLDDNAPKISDSYNAVKSGEAVQTLTGRPVPADMTKMPLQPGQPGYNFATDMENGGALQPDAAQAGLYDTPGFTTKTTGMENYDNLLAGKPNGADMGKSAKVIMMSPDEYLAQIPKTSASTSRVSEYATKMQQGDKFPMATLDSSSGGFTQEGRARALAAKEAGIKQMPVMQVSDVAQPAISDTLPIDRFTGTTGVSMTPTDKIFNGNELESSQSLGYEGNTVEKKMAQIKNGERPTVTIGKNGDQLVVENGNHTLEAYKRLGIKDIPFTDNTGGNVRVTQPAQAQPTPSAELKTRLQLPNDETMVGVSSKPPFQNKVSTQVKTPGKVSLVKQNLRPLISILKNSQDPMAREIAQRYIEADANHTMMSGQARTALEDATKKLSKADYENAVDAAEGKAVPNNEAVSQWLNTYDQFRKDVATESADSNLKIYNPEQMGFVPWEARDNYFPHFTSDKALQAMKNDPKAIQDIINKGYAHDSFTAQNMINSKFSNLKSKRYGNLETSRSDFPAPYVKDPRVALDYFDGAYRRLGQAKYFGANSEIVNNLIDKMAKNGNEYEANAARQLITRVVGKNPGFQAPEEAAIKDVTDLLHNMETMTKLGFITPGHHAAALAALASRVGPVNTLKASTELLKGVVGQYSQLTRENVARVHAPQSDLYGKNAGLFDKFYSGIGLNRTLNALSAVGAHAANSRLNEMESNLTNPVWQRDMVKANIDPAAVAQRGKFTPQERTQYITSVLQDASLLIKPGDMPKLTDSQLGRMAMMLKGPAYQRTARLYPYVGKEVLHGRMSPILAFAILGTLFAAGGIVIGNQIQNKPAPTSADLLKQGALRGIGPIGGEEVANMIQYPEYTGATMAGLVGGPVASDIVNGTQIAANWNSPNENTALGARRNLVRNIPIVGPTVANTLLPFKSYVGNRPSDVISAKLRNQQITHNPGDFQYQTSPSLKDLVVQNPKVTQEKAQAANIASFDKAAVGQLDQTQQVKFDAINKFLQDPYNGGNNLSKINAYSALQNDSQMALVKSMQEVEAAKESGKPINPLWSIGLTDPAAQKIVLQYKGLLPAEQKNFKSDPVHVRVLNEYNALEADYYQKLPQSAAAKSSGITAPSPSKGASDKLNQYSASKAAGKPNYALLDDPEVKQYYSQLDFYDSYINGLAGLTGTTGSGSGGSSGYSSNNANYYERAMQRQYMYAALRDSMQMPALNLKALPTPQVKAPGQAFASLKLPQPKVALPGVNGTPGSSSGPKLNRVSFKAPSGSPTRSSAIGIRTIS